MELKITGLTKKYGEKVAVNHLNLVLLKGVYGLLGANGAGKTSLMRMLATVASPTSGKILWDRKEIGEMGEEYRSLIGYLPQQFVSYPDFTAREFLIYMAAVKGVRRSLAGERADELLEAVGLKNERKKKIKTFSGGMKQRLGIAQALTGDPQLLILDEPTAGLDPKERVRFRNLISEFSKDRIVILSTHIVSDVEAIAEEIILMKAGQVLQFGKPHEITAEIAGQVWECTVPAERAGEYAGRWNVGNLRNEEDGTAILRVIAEHLPVEGAIRVQPNLEDLYLYYFGDQQ